jgi:hypothetical protein
VVKETGIKYTRTCLAWKTGDDNKRGMTLQSTTAPVKSCRLRQASKLFSWAL